MTEPEPSIRSTFVASYPRYVASLLSERGVQVDQIIADGIVEGVAVLDGLLTSLERTAPALQRHSPLELFREALRPVGHALDVSGVSPPARDDQQRSLISWDRYALSPASPQLLGVEAYESHLRWGVAKARALVQTPTVGLLCSEADAEMLISEISTVGYGVLRLPAREPVSVAVVDIAHSLADDTIRALAAAGSRVIAFGLDPDDMVEVRTRALGAHAIVSRTAFFSDVSTYLPTIT